MTTQHAELPQALHVAVLACQVAQDERNAAFARLIRSHDRAEQSRLNQAHDQATKAAEAAFAALQRAIEAEGGYALWRLSHDRHHHTVVRPTRESRARRDGIARLEARRIAAAKGADPRSVYVVTVPVSLAPQTRTWEAVQGKSFLAEVTYDHGRFGTWSAVAYGVVPESDRAFHTRIAAMDDQEAALAELDARYHDGLAEGANCHLCGIEHAAVNPEASRPVRGEPRSWEVGERLCRSGLLCSTDWPCGSVECWAPASIQPAGVLTRQDAPRGATTAQDARTAPDLTDWAPGETTEVYGR